jgi:hypothetical protein
MRSGIRLAQGNYVRITVTKPIPVQVDGEPWIQAPGNIIISAAGPKVTAFPYYNGANSYNFTVVSFTMDANLP